MSEKQVYQVECGTVFGIHAQFFVVATDFIDAATQAQLKREKSIPLQSISLVGDVA